MLPNRKTRFSQSKAAPALSESIGPGVTSALRSSPRPAFRPTTNAPAQPAAASSRIRDVTVRPPGKSRCDYGNRLRTEWIRVLTGPLHAGDARLRIGVPLDSVLPLVRYRLGSNSSIGLPSGSSI